MLFNSALFASFFLVVFCLYFFVTDNRSYKLWLLTIANIVFYASWGYRYLPILMGTGIVDYYLALAIYRHEDAVRRRTLVTLSVVMNLAVLAFFKYTNFFLANVAQGVRLFHVNIGVHSLSIIAPLGISFYLFQSISYTVDVYRKTFRPKTRLLEFIASLTFFPHLLSGPIIRSASLLPQFEKLQAPAWEVSRRAFVLVAAGMAKKTTADLLAPVAEHVFSGGGNAQSSLATWTGVLAFAGQIYGDFSGYTDIAIGIAALLGFTFPQNFDLPYLATSPSRFWQRWHISLSTWFRDYCYMPLVLRNRKVNWSLFLTMAWMGLWHGAQWTFVVYGVYHGVLLVLDSALTKKFASQRRPSAIRSTSMVLLTFYLVAVGFIWFRAESLGVAIRVLRDLHWSKEPSVFTFTASLTLVLTVVGLLACHALDYALVKKATMIERSPIFWPATALLLSFAIAFGGSGGSFIYFQF